jgi:SAM-dependent methyltransferase
MPSTNFDYCANEYSSIFELPFIKYGDYYTLIKKIGDVSGRSVLDVGCGEGTVARLLKSQGAFRVVGVDLSEGMVELAREQENRQGSGVEYLCRDLRMLETIGQFDLVIASFIFTLAHTRDNLLKMCQAVHANLKPGGRLLVADDNLFLAPDKYSALEKYGFMKEIDGPLHTGSVVTCTLRLNAEDLVVKETWLGQDTWMETLGVTGFGNIEWFAPEVDPQGIKLFGEAFWHDYINLPASVFFSAVTV